MKTPVMYTHQKKCAWWAISILVAGISKFGPIYVGALAKFDATPIRESNEMEGINAERTMSFYPNPASAEISVES